MRINKRLSHSGSRINVLMRSDIKDNGRRTTTTTGMCLETEAICAIKRELSVCGKARHIRKPTLHILLLTR